MRLCGWKWNETKLTALFGLARHSNKKNPAARKIFWKKNKFNIDLDCGVTRKACITEDLSDHPSMGYHRGKEETFQLKDSFHFSTCIVTWIHKYLAFLLWPVSKWFYNLFLILPDVILQNGLVHCSQTGWAIKESWMGKRATRVPLQRRELLQLWKDHSRCEEDPHSRWAEYLQGMGTHKEGGWWESTRTNGGTLTKSWHSEIPRGRPDGEVCQQGDRLQNPWYDSEAGPTPWEEE